MHDTAQSIFYSQCVDQATGRFLKNTSASPILQWGGRLQLFLGRSRHRALRMTGKAARKGACGGGGEVAAVGPGDGGWRGGGGDTHVVRTTCIYIYTHYSTYI